MTTNIAYWGPGSDDPALAEFRTRLRDEWLRRGYGWVDDEKKAEVDIQKLTDKYIGDIDGQLAAKEKEIMQV